MNLRRSRNQLSTEIFSNFHPLLLDEYYSGSKIEKVDVMLNTTCSNNHLIWIMCSNKHDIVVGLLVQPAALFHVSLPHLLTYLYLPTVNTKV